MPPSNGHARRMSCPACGSCRIEGFLRIADAPLHCNLLWRSREDAVSAPRADIHLTGCLSCSHVFNPCFDPSLMHYTEQYDAALDFSPHFQSYAETLAKTLIEKHGLENKHIIDIGCGKGEFLKLLCRDGRNRGTGFDPSYEAPVGREETNDVRFIRDFYDERHASVPADLICCRQVLEHIAEPAAFLSMIRSNLGSRRTLLHFEVPNWLYTFHDLGIWDIIYEHPSYFTSTSLTTLFERRGFCALETGTAYDNQFLWIEARPA